MQFDERYSNLETLRKGITNIDNKTRLCTSRFAVDELVSFYEIQYYYHLDVPCELHHVFY